MKKGFTLITMIAILAFVTLMTGAVYAMCLIALKDTSRLQKDGFHSQMVSCVSSMSNSLRMYGSDWRPLTNSMQVPGDDENTYLTEFKLCDSSDWNINPQFYMSASLGKKRYDEYRDIFWTNKNIFDFNKRSEERRVGKECRL